MDIKTLLEPYSADDFARAFRSLLPNGGYWQALDNRELTELVEAVGIEFKRIHDDIQLSLTANDKPIFGWKLTDYRQLLAELGVEGEITDKIETPNIIYVAFEADERSGRAIDEFEAIRLPHTLIYWSFCSRAPLFVNVATARHIRNYHRYEVRI